ncbi:hypothetical protein L195_g003186 [Trifolium pratense]|uniref:Uncharacterized protein n=1 Tax=Trifolium pratense TaxID=57577 RepID=A0A2K3NUJ6_TRIPR|nr:hypothetical protein L195_g003186 [Trifolium pratense]
MRERVVERDSQRQAQLDLLVVEEDQDKEEQEDEEMQEAQPELEEECQNRDLIQLTINGNRLYITYWEVFSTNEQWRE